MLRPGLAGVRLRRRAAVGSTTSTLLALVSRLLSFGASAAGVMAQPSRLCDTISDGTVTCCSAMLATPSGWLRAIFHSGLARVIVDDSTNPSTLLAAMAPSAAEKVPMLVPMSQTGALACCYAGSETQSRHNLAVWAWGQRG